MVLGNTQPPQVEVVVVVVMTTRTYTRVALEDQNIPGPGRAVICNLINIQTLLMANHILRDLVKTRTHIYIGHQQSQPTIGLDPRASMVQHWRIQGPESRRKELGQVGAVEPLRGDSQEKLFLLARTPLTVGSITKMIIEGPRVFLLGCLLLHKQFDHIRRRSLDPHRGEQ